MQDTIKIISFFPVHRGGKTGQGEAIRSGTPVDVPARNKRPEARAGEMGFRQPPAVGLGVVIGHIKLDESLRRFDTVFPACGSANSAIELTLDELERASGARQWVDVCKGWRDET